MNTDNVYNTQNIKQGTCPISKSPNYAFNSEVFINHQFQSKTNLLSKFTLQSNCDCGAGCSYVKIIPAGDAGSNACCSQSPYFFDWYEYPSGCSDTQDYECGYITVNAKPCAAGGSCWEASINTCDSFDGCEDNDGDGYFGQSPICFHGTDCDDDNVNIHPNQDEICDDENKNDENCDGPSNCEDPACHGNSTCDEECDKDGDGYYSSACGGNDCKDDPNDDSNAANIFPGNDHEDTEELCKDGKNNDCDSDTDCIDSSCKNGSTNFCPDCLAVEICVLGSGDEDCNGFADCDDINACPNMQGCATPTPTPSPTPGDGGGDGGGGDGGGGGDHCDCGDCVNGCGGGGDCHVEIIPNNDCCPWNPYTYTCYACQDFEIIVCD